MLAQPLCLLGRLAAGASSPRLARASRAAAGRRWRPQPRCTEKQLMRDFDVDVASRASTPPADPAAARSARPCTPSSGADRAPAPPLHRLSAVSRKPASKMSGRAATTTVACRFAGTPGWTSLASALACAATMAQRLRVGVRRLHQREHERSRCLAVVTVRRVRRARHEGARRTSAIHARAHFLDCHAV